MGRVSGKVVIITGAASGMGLAASMLFCQEGATVIAGYNRTPFPEDSLKKSLDMDGEIVPAKLTVSSEEDWKKTTAMAVEKFGKIDVLINNAGGYSPKCSISILEATDKDWYDMLATNLVGPALGIKYVIPEMLKNNGGSIINTSSSSAYSPDMHCPSSYCAAKGGIHSLTKHIAMEYGKNNIRVNTIVPGTFYTGGIQKSGLTQEQMAALYVEKAPLPPHASDPINIAKGYLYLASDDSKFVTGAKIAIDGGMTI